MNSLIPYGVPKPQAGRDIKLTLTFRCEICDATFEHMSLGEYPNWPSEYGAAPGWRHFGQAGWICDRHEVEMLIDGRRWQEAIEFERLCKLATDEAVAIESALA